MTQERIALLVRGDDMGSTRAANLACIDCYRNGIVRSVEVMVPGPWFEGARRLLNENPELDVGVHLALTSEWDEFKWRPLTPCRSIVDEAGHFLPAVWPRAGTPRNASLCGADWRIGEIEAELRAQIELAIARLPHVSHLTGHMGWEEAHPEFAALFQRLASVYGLEPACPSEPLRVAEGYDKSGPAEAQISSFIERLRGLTPGFWLFVEHPAYDDPEMAGIYHTGYPDVGKDRGVVTRVLTSAEARGAIAECKIELVSYKRLAAGATGGV